MEIKSLMFSRHQENIKRLKNNKGVREFITQTRH
jgi:hypothetical protein